jgi:hypothetical protein
VGETAATRRADRLARHHGHRSELTVDGEWTRYGDRLAVTPYGERMGVTAPGTDEYWLTSATYTYRLLDDLYDIHFGIVIMRGSLAQIESSAGEVLPADVPAGSDDPGFYAGRGGVTYEVGRLFSLESDLILGATETGFAAGVSGLVRIGQIAATRAELSVDFIPEAGSTGTFRFAWDTVPQVPMSLSVEVSDRPLGDSVPSATRMLFDAGVELTSGLTLSGRVGYGARTDGLKGGPILGLGTTISF